MGSGFVGEKKTLFVIGSGGMSPNRLDARSKFMRKDTRPPPVGSPCAGLSLQRALFKPPMDPLCRRGTEAKPGLCGLSEAVEEVGPAVREGSRLRPCSHLSEAE